MIDEQLAEFPRWTVRRDWDGLEAEFRRRAKPPDKAARIADVDLTAYERALDKALARALERAHKKKAAAVYFEYDLDGFWSSSFFICATYRPEAAADDDWACDWIDEVEGPDQEELGLLYQESGFDRDAEGRSATLFLIARTVAALGRCFDRHPAAALAVCMGFHDQDPILRLQDNPATA